MTSMLRVRARALSLFGLLTLLGGCQVAFGPALTGSGVAKTEPRDVAPFSRIEVSNAIQLDVVVGPRTSLEVTADDNILPYVKTVVSGDRLQIYVDASFSSQLGVAVKASAPALDEVVASGASRVTATGVAGDEFRLDLSGASTCDLNADVDALDATLSGASRGAFTGAARRLALDCSGASRVDAADLKSDSVVAQLSGASNARVHAAAELAATASGASTLRYWGAPSKVVEDTSGASNIAPE
jgi:hypothetical protein